MVTPQGLLPATIAVKDGKVESIGLYEGTAGFAEDLGDLVLLPGVVDSHVHINEPGRTDWEGFASATRSAAAGGITTLVDMPLNSIPATTSAAALAAKRSAASGQLQVDVGFWGGVVPGNEDQIEPLWRAGVLGFKCFLVPSGVDEVEAVSTADLERAMPILARLGAPPRPRRIPGRDRGPRLRRSAALRQLPRHPPARSRGDGHRGDCAPRTTASGRAFTSSTSPRSPDSPKSNAPAAGRGSRPKPALIT